MRGREEGGRSESVKLTLAWIIISYFVLNRTRKCLANPLVN